MPRSNGHRRRRLQSFGIARFGDGFLKHGPEKGTSSGPQYPHLDALDQIAVLPEELTETAVRSLRTAKAPAEATRLNEFMV